MNVTANGVRLEVVPGANLTGANLTGAKAGPGTDFTGAILR